MGQCHICVGRLTMEACPCRDRPAVHCASSTLYTLISRGELSRDCALRPFAFGSLALRAAAAPAAVYQLSRSLLHSSWLPVPPGAASPQPPPGRHRRRGRQPARQGGQISDRPGPGHCAAPQPPHPTIDGIAESGGIIRHAQRAAAHLGGIYSSHCRVDSPNFAFRLIFGLFSGPVGPRRVSDGASGRRIGACMPQHQ